MVETALELSPSVGFLCPILRFIFPEGAGTRAMMPTAICHLKPPAQKIGRARLVFLKIYYVRIGVHSTFIFH